MVITHTFGLLSVCLSVGFIFFPCALHNVALTGLLYGIKKP